MLKILIKLRFFNQKAEILITTHQFLEIAKVNNSIYNNIKNTDKTTYLSGITDDHLSQYMEVAKDNNSNHNNAKNTDKSSFLRV